MDLESPHGGFAGPTLIEKIQDQADKAFMYRNEHDGDDGFNRGVAEGVLVGLLRALSILRGSSEASEWTEAQERHGIIAAGGTVPRSEPKAVVITGTTRNDAGVERKVRVVVKRDKYIAKFKELGLQMDLSALSDGDIERLARDCGIKV